MAKKKQPKYDPDWARAKKLCRLSMEDIRMAKELGLNPRKLPGHNPSPSQQWKLPVKLWIRELYEKRKRKQAARRERKELPAEPVELTTSVLDDDLWSTPFEDEIPF